MSIANSRRRFGAANPAFLFHTRVRWVVACLTSMIILLLGTVISLVRSIEDDSTKPNPHEAVATEVAAPRVEVLIAAARIETGALIDESMLKTLPLDPNLMPEGALLASHRHEVIGRYATGTIKANFPLLQDGLTTTPTTTAAMIPPGMRALTIMVDKQSGVEGWAKPDSRVDVLWTYKEQLATVSRFVRIFSVGGNRETTQERMNLQGNVPVTLIVSETDAQKLELARSLGKLSLVLLGTLDPGINSQAGNAPMTAARILRGFEETPDTLPPIDGWMTVRDERTGKIIKYALRGNNWELLSIV